MAFCVRAIAFYAYRVCLIAVVLGPCVGAASLVGFLAAGLVTPLMGLPVTLICIVVELLVIKKLTVKQAA